MLSIIWLNLHLRTGFGGFREAATQVFEQADTQEPRSVATHVASHGGERYIGTDSEHVPLAFRL